MPGSNSRPLPAEDMAHVLEHTQGIWEDLRGGCLFVTGGSGFFGRWMLETFLHANDELGLGADAIVVTRSVEGFAAGAPHIARHHSIQLLAGDVRTFDAPRTEVSHVLHMATETALDQSPTASFDTAVDGTRRVLRLAVERGARGFLLTSSGAVYGTQPPDLQQIPEDYPGAPPPDDPGAGYAHGKRAAEFLCIGAAAQTGLPVKIARGFAFVGPLLPLDSGFAIGNFIRDALFRDRIEVAGDGTPRRSYLYAADLAIWLWTILARGQPRRPYNVGSEADVSIGELAAIVGRVLRPGLPISINRVADSGLPAPRYVPCTNRAAIELGLREHVVLEDGILRTSRWYSAGPMP